MATGNFAQFATAGLRIKAASQPAQISVKSCISITILCFVFLFSVVCCSKLNFNLSNVLPSYIPLPQKGSVGFFGSPSLTLQKSSECEKNAIEEDHRYAAYDLTYPLDNRDSENKLRSFPVCGTWQPEYNRIHREMVAENGKNGKGKFLIFSSCRPGFACGGVGDHLLGMSSIFLLAVMHKRAFLVEWPELEATEAFLPSTFNWQMKTVTPNNQNIVVTDINCGVSPDSSDSFEINALNFDVGGGEDRLSGCIGKLHNASIIRVHINRGISHWAVTQHEDSVVGKFIRQAGMKPSLIAGCLLRNLIRTNEKILSRVEAPLKELQSTNKLKVCIHARRRYDRDTEFTGGGVNMDAYLEETKTLLSCANTLFEYWGQASVGTIWYFMAGSEELKKKVKELYTDKILESGVPVMHTDLHENRSLALETTVAEWHLYTQCHFFVFHSSGMSKTAATFAMRPFSMYSFGNNAWSKLRNQCNPVQSSTPTELGTDWSGL